MGAPSTVGDAAAQHSDQQTNLGGATAQHAHGPTDTQQAGITPAALAVDKGDNTDNYNAGQTTTSPTSNVGSNMTDKTAARDKSA